MTESSDRKDASRERPEARDGESLEELVAGVFGDRRPPVAGPGAAPEIPPEPAAAPEPEPESETTAEARPEPETDPFPALAAPPPAEPAPAPGPPPVEMPDPEAEAPRDDEPPRRRSLWERLQVSPAVIVASLIAGVTGAAADHWFEDLAVFVGELRTADAELSEAPVIDIRPEGVAPSDFSTEAAEEGTGGAMEPAAGPLPAAAGSAPPAPGPDAPAGEASPGDPAPAAAEAAPAADRVRLVTWDERESETVVTFWGNGPFLPERVVRFRVEGGSPRELLKLRGIDLPYRLTAIDAGTPELVRIRTGFHPQDRVNELHVVLDLAHPGVELTRLEGTGDSLRVHLRAAGTE